MNSNKTKPTSILVLGITGLIGNTIFRYLSDNSDFSVFGTIRNSAAKKFFFSNQLDRIFSSFEASAYLKWQRIFKKIKPDVVINCIGITKHSYYGNDPLKVIPVNAYFPHFLNTVCDAEGARLIQISSDCVFLGEWGNYSESDPPDAIDLYGRSKALGETIQGAALTLRTSTIGHELYGSAGLLEWFLKQKGSCQGFKKAFFSGLSTIELAKVIKNYVIPNPRLQGLYQVGAARISKFDLLVEIASVYRKKIEIIPNDEFKIDRSLNVEQFFRETGYQSPSWKQMIQEMHRDKEKNVQR